jgi:2',3'-cyclic-nucleotide 2'-phosphodiesterase (5'-nucleotidase family)
MQCGKKPIFGLYNFCFGTSNPTMRSNRMRIRLIGITLATLLLLSCKPQYQIVEMNGSITEMDNRFNTPQHGAMHALVHSYKRELDDKMNEVIGTSVQVMMYGRPESLLTNLTSDVMKAYGDEHLEGGADVAMMNVHGHRASMPAGEITVGNLYEIYSFDNAITFLEMKGSDLTELFSAYARIGGAGISSNVRLAIENHRIKEVTLNGEAIDPDRIYRVVTLDYLAEGNDNMSAMRNALTHHNTGVTLRDVMIDYVKKETRRGNPIRSALDGRITIIDQE